MSPPCATPCAPTHALNPRAPHAPNPRAPPVPDPRDPPARARPQDRAPKFIASFGFTDAIISWLTTDENMVTLYLVHSSSKKAAKLHFVTQVERVAMSTLCLHTPRSRASQG